MIKEEKQKLELICVDMNIMSGDSVSETLDRILQRAKAMPRELETSRDFIKGMSTNCQNFLE